MFEKIRSYLSLLFPALAYVIAGIFFGLGSNWLAYLIATLFIVWGMLMDLFDRSMNYNNGCIAGEKFAVAQAEKYPPLSTMIDEWLGMGYVVTLRKNSEGRIIPELTKGDQPKP